jgi:hypothetical protein
MKLNPSFVPNIQSVTLPISEIRYVSPARVGSTNVPASVIVDGNEFSSTNRFRDSLLGLIGQSNSIFRLFSAEDVFNRFQEVNGSRIVNVNYEVETGRAISLTNGKSGRSVLDFNHLREDVIGDAPISYHDGVVRAMLEPFRTEGFMVNNDVHLPRISLHVPLDGYGGVQSFLSMLRQVCSNGMVAMGSAFKHTIKIAGGDNPVATLRRFKNAFYDEDGYSDLRDRLNTAGETPASIGEFSRLLKLVTSSNISLGLLGKIEQSVSDTQEYYGLSALNAIDEKRARQVPSKLSVYDLINMSSEISTHVTDSPQVANRLQALCGDLLSNQFDLEGMNTKLEDDSSGIVSGQFEPTFFVDPSEIAGVKRSGFGFSSHASLN